MDGAPDQHNAEDANNRLPQTLRMWLSQVGSFAGRTFLEEQFEVLLTPDMEQALAEEVAARAARGEDTDDLAERLAIVREARQRGGHIAAIRETYVDAKGGFTLDVPVWFDAILGQYLDLYALSPEQTAHTRIDLFTDALERAALEPNLPPESVAELHNKRGVAYKEDPQRDRAQALEAAIADHMAALTVYTRQRYPRQWALTQNNLGFAYSKRMVGIRADNMERAIAYFQKARRIYTKTRYPAQYATVMNNLGGAYQERIVGSTRDNHERGIRFLRRALAMWARLAFPVQQAHTLYNLGTAYEDRIAGDHRDNIERAIAYFGATLEVLAVVDPSHHYALIDYAHAKNHLALAYSERSAGRPRDNFEEAIKHLIEVENALDPQLFPTEWALTRHNLGHAYHGRIAGSKRDNLEQARDHYLTALHVRTRSHLPGDYATTLNNLGVLYKDRISGDPRENIEAAIACFQEALEIRTLSAMPLDYAASQNNLGGAYWTHRFGDRSDHIEHAIACFSEALAVYSRADAAEDRAMTLMNLGIAYWSRIVGDREDNLERARAYLEEALTIYTEKAFPDRHAIAQSNLGAIYLRRLAGTRTENLARASACFIKALDICAADEDSLLFRDAHLNLASLAFEGRAPEAEARGDREGVRAAYSDAHAHYHAARISQRNLGWLESDAQGRARLQGANHALRELYVRDAWCLLRLGDVRRAAEALEEGRAQALFEAQAIAGALLGQVCAAHRGAYTAARQAMAEASGEASGETRIQRRAARDDFLALRKAIRAHCAPDFLQDAASYEEIACAAAPDQALIYLAACEAGGFALVIPPRHDAPAPFPQPFDIALRRLTWRTVDDWLRTPDEANRVRSGYQLALQRRGMATLLRVFFHETDAQTVETVLGLPLRDLPDLLPPSMATLRVALRRAVQDIFDPPRSAATQSTYASGRGDAYVAETGARVASTLMGTPEPLESPSDSPPESPSVGEVLGNSDVFQRLTRQLTWHHQIAELDALAPALRRVIVEPLRDELVIQGLGSDAQRIALVPCGRLGVLPLHATPVHEDGLPLAETCELTYQASARTLAFARTSLDKLATHGPIFAVGNPHHTTDNAALPHAGHEAAAIARIGRRAGYAASLAVVGANATRSRVLAELQRFRELHPGAWFHCAGHGRASSYDPAESYMLLSGFDADGRPERLALDLLQRQQVLSGMFGVTASGCVTGLGDMELAPDELNSFAAGLLQAGAGCVVATLWSVKDYATSLLMTRFHQARLSHPHVSPASALRTATRWLRTATQSDIDVFAREVGLPCWSDVDGVRDAVRGEVTQESFEERKRGDRSAPDPTAAADEHARSGGAHQVDSERVLKAARAPEVIPEPSGHDLPYAHPVYWAAPIVVGA